MDGNRDKSGSVKGKGRERTGPIRNGNRKLKGRDGKEKGSENRQR